MIILNYSVYFSYNYLYWWYTAGDQFFLYDLDKRTPLLFLLTYVILLSQGQRGRQENFFIMSKDFLYYCGILVKEGLDIETEKPHLEQLIDKTISTTLFSAFYNH